MIEIFQKYKNIIKDYQIICWDSEPLTYRFKAQINFINGSTLIVKDYLFSTGRKYSFQWQDKAGNLLIRWDNASHWKKIDTFPHHKHQKNEVFPSKEFTLYEVLQYLSEILENQT